MLCESSQDHVLLMKKAVEVPFKELVEGPAPELKIEEICELSDDGISIRRVYVNTDQDHPFAEVGWVHNEDVTACMSCEQDFGFFRWRHHCRTCGLLVCGECTATAMIQGYASLGEQTVCTKCFSKAGSEGGVPLSAESVWGTEVYRAPDRPVQQDVVEVRAAPATLQADPTPGFVIETRRSTPSADKVYINVFHNAGIRDFYRVLTNNGHASDKSSGGNVGSGNVGSGIVVGGSCNVGSADVVNVVNVDGSGGSGYEHDEQDGASPDGISALSEPTMQTVHTTTPTLHTTTSHSAHSVHTVSDKVTPLVYVYGPCKLESGSGRGTTDTATGNVAGTNNGSVTITTDVTTADNTATATTPTKDVTAANNAATNNTSTATYTSLNTTTPTTSDKIAPPPQVLIYNVLVSSAYFDRDLIRDDSVLITHSTSVNKIIQVVNKNFNEHLVTTTFSLPLVTLRYLGGVPPPDAHYTRSNCSVYNTPASTIVCSKDYSGVSSSVNSPYTLSGYSTRYSSRKDTAFDRFSLGLFSTRISPDANSSLQAVALKSPSTLVGCEIVYPHDPAALPVVSETDQTLLYIVTHCKHTTLRGTWYCICNVQTKKSKWVKLKRGPGKSGKDFYITRQYLGSAKEYGAEKSE